MIIHHTQMGKKMLGQNESLLPNKKQNQHPVQNYMFGKNSCARSTDKSVTNRHDKTVKKKAAYTFLLTAVLTKSLVSL
jgi:hypothetical protein